MGMGTENSRQPDTKDKAGQVQLKGRLRRFVRLVSDSILSLQVVWSVSACVCAAHAARVLRVCALP